jgi:death-on-curing protein
MWPYWNRPWRGPRNLLSYKSGEASPAQLAAAYAFGIVKNHPFVDGNKRTGLVVAFVFLVVNGVEIRASEEDAYQIFIDLASGKLRETELATWIGQNAL